MRNFAIKAKKAIKKVAAISVGAAMVGSTLFGAAAAANLDSYPAPFVQDGLWNTVVVVGAAASAGDIVGAIDVSARLSQTATTAYSETQSVTEVAGGVSLNSGTNRLWLGRAINNNVNVITKTNFPTILADGTFVDDYGTETTYVQKIEPGEATFTYGNSNSDIDDPALMIQGGENANTASERFFSYTLTFESELNFTSTDVQGELLTILGKEYTIGSSSDTDTIQLFGGSVDVELNWGEIKTVTFGGTDYEIRLAGIQSGNPNVATVVVNGESKTVNQGTTKTIGGLSVYASSVNYYGLDAYPGDAVISLGADEFYLEHQTAVMSGSSKDEVEGTYATVSYTTDFARVSGFTIHFSAEDRKLDHLLSGDEYVDPVFGKIKILFAEPVIGETSTIETVIKGDEELWLGMTDSKGNTATVPFTYNKNLVTSRSEDIIVVENATLTEDDYFILNSGNNQHFMQVRRIDIGGTSANDKVHLKDVFTGTTYKIESTNLDADTATVIIDGITYYIDKVSTSSIRIWQGSSISVYPYMELFDTKTTRIAWTDSVTAITGAEDGDTVSVVLPTGAITLAFENVTTNACNVTLTGATPTTILGNNTARAVEVGSAHYVFTVTDYGDNTSLCQDATVTIAMSANQATGNTTAITDAAILIVEEENSIDSTKHALLLKSSDGGSASYTSLDASNALWTYTSAPSLVTFDDSNYKATYSTFGTYLYYDGSDSNQKLSEIVIPKNQMYANVFIAPTAATTTTTVTTGAVAINPVSGVETAKLDTEITDKTAKPMILVGGPAVNRLTAEVAGLSYPTYGEGSQDVFGYSSGRAVIKLFENAFGGSKVAMVVAGWEEADTRRACKVLKDYANYDLSGDHMIVTGTATTPVIEPYVESA